MIHHRQHGDRFASVVFHALNCFNRQQVCVDGDWVRGHQVFCSQHWPALRAVSTQRAPQVAIGDQTQQASGMCGIFHPAAADRALRERADHIWKGCLWVNGVEIRCWDHQIGHGHRELLAQGASWVIKSEIGRRDAPPFHPDGGQRIANGHGHGCAGCGREIQGAHLPVNGGLQHHVTAMGE